MAGQAAGQAAIVSRPAYAIPVENSEYVLFWALIGDSKRACSGGEPSVSFADDFAGIPELVAGGPRR